MPVDGVTLTTLKYNPSSSETVALNGTFGFDNLFEGNKGLYVAVPDNGSKDVADVKGLKIVEGLGTQDNPYVFAVEYKTELTASDFTLNFPNAASYESGQAWKVSLDTNSPVYNKIDLTKLHFKYYTDSALQNEIENSQDTGVTEAGTYYVGLTYEGDDNYKATTTVIGGGWSFTVNRATPTVEPKEGLKYTGNAQNLVTATEGAGIKYGVPGEAVSNEADSALSLNADDIKVGAIYSPTDDNGITFPSNYTVKYKTKTCTNAKVVKTTAAYCLCSGTTYNDLPYDKNAVMVTDVTGTEITVVAVNTDIPAECFIGSPTVPTGTNAGTYTVYYKTEGNHNHH